MELIGSSVQHIHLIVKLDSFSNLYIMMTNSNSSLASFFAENMFWLEQGGQTGLAHVSVASHA